MLKDLKPIKCKTKELLVLLSNYHCMCIPIRDWGRPGNFRTLNIDWHVPSEEEVAETTRIVRKFAAKHLEALRRFAGGEDADMTKERKHEIAPVSLK